MGGKGAAGEGGRLMTRGGTPAQTDWDSFRPQHRGGASGSGLERGRQTDRAFSQPPTSGDSSRNLRGGGDDRGRGNSARRSYTPRPKPRRLRGYQEPDDTVMYPAYRPCPWNHNGDYVDDAVWAEVHYDEADYDVLRTHEPMPRLGNTN